MPDYPIFDVHHHVGGLQLGGGAAGAFDMEADYALREQYMDRFGFRAGAIMPPFQYLRPDGIRDTQKLNDFVAAYRDRHRERLPIAMGTVELLQGEEAGLAELERMATGLKLNGVAWHHGFQGTMIDDRRMPAFLRKLGDLHLPAFIHIWAEQSMESAWRLEALAERFPELPIVALDAFTGYDQARHVFRIARHCPNLLFDTAGFVPLNRMLEDFVAELGSQRLLFGTNLYLNPPTYHYPHVLNEILHAPRLTEEDKRNIFWGNAQRLFNLPAPVL